MIYVDPEGEAPLSVITSGLGGIFGFGSTFVQDLLDDGKINTDWKKYLGNTIEGATTGFGLGLCGPACGALGDFTGNIANQAMNTGKIDLSQSLVNATTTLITSSVFKIGGPVTSHGIEYVKDYALKGFLSGTIGDTTYQILNNGITRDSNGNAIGYDLQQSFRLYNPSETLRTGILGAIVTPIGAKVSDSAINKWNNYQTNKIINQVNITSVNNGKISSIGNQYSLNKVSPYSGLSIYSGTVNRIVLPKNNSQLKHIFRNAEGHLDDTLENRKLLENVANDKNNYLGTANFNKRWYGKINSDGTQTWVSVRNGVIQDGGLNKIPHSYNSKTGLSASSRGWK